MPTSSALILALNCYAAAPPLRGCVNDAADVERLLVESCGYRPAEVRVLADADATKGAVLEELARLAHGAQAGDRRHLHASAHGSWVPDRSGDEPDCRDEVVCLHDMDWGDPGTYLLDDELRVWAAGFPPGVRLTTVLDACHSGTGTRSLSPPGASGIAGRPLGRARVALDDTASRAGIAPAAAAQQALYHYSPQLIFARFAPPPGYEDLAPEPRRKPRGARAPLPPVVADFAALAACREDETAADAYFPGAAGEAGHFQGALTHALTASVRRSALGAATSGAGLLAGVRAVLRQGRFSQRPQLEEVGAAGRGFFA